VIDMELLSVIRRRLEIKALMERGFHRPGDVENRLGFYVGQIGG
jgi:hypothetical protein